MLDRKTQPSFNPLRKVSIPKITTSTLDNGTRLSYLNHESTNVFKLELVIKAGSWYASDYHLVPLTLRMLNEGTVKRSGKSIAEEFDKLGSFIELTPGFDNSSLVIYGLTKFFESNLNLIEEVFFHPSFDEVAFTNLKKREAQKLELNLEKSSYKASTLHRKNIFGTTHPYGAISNPKTLKSITVDQIREFYGNQFGSFDILISGNLPDNFQNSIDNLFNIRSNDSLSSALAITHTLTNLSEPKIEERNSKFIQSSIRLGKTIFNRNHVDYIDFMVLNEVLGGYFGSRLMRNIREDKGYTYGIYSQLYALNHAGYFTIGTDVDADNESKTIDEIHLEIERLRNDQIPEEELLTVKNYMSGTFAGSLGTPFSLMDKYKAVFYQGLDMSFFDAYVERINAVNSLRLQSLANEYLSEESFSLAVVGR